MHIRPFNSDDAQSFYNWYHDKRLSHFYRGYITGVSLDQCRNAPQFMRGHILVGVNEEQSLVGAVTLADKDHILRIYKLGLLVDPQHQHHGYGAKLLAAGLDFAFNTMCAHKVVIESLANDERVATGAKAAGFISEGCLRENIYLEGSFQDELTFGLLHSEYKLRSEYV